MCGTVWDKMLSKPEFSNLDIKEYFSNVSSMFCTCSYGQAGRALSSCLSIKRLPETVWQPHSSTRSSTGDPPAAWGCPSPSHAELLAGLGAERRSVTCISSSQALPSCLCIGERNSLMAGLDQSPMVCGRWGCCLSSEELWVISRLQLSRQKADISQVSIIPC